MAYTLNQIVKKITDYGSQHPQIKFVLYGDVVDHLSQGEVTYPAFFFNMSGVSILAKQITFTFSLYFMDRQIENTEEIEVMSDQLLICQDIIAFIRDNANEWLVSENIPMEFFVESEPDVLAGVKADVTLTLSSINNRCQIPV
jgi:methionine salvage enolase-phosphatase E1